MKHRTLVKYLVSYAIILFIPILIFSFIINTYFIGYYSDTIIKENINSIQKVKNNFDIQIRYLNSNAIQMARNPTYSTSRLSEDLTAFYDVFNNLNVIKSTNNFLSDAFYYNKNLNNIYTSGAICSFYDFDRYFCHYANYNSIQLKRFFDTIGRSNIWLPQQNVSYNGKSMDMITYVVPLEWNSSFVYSMVIYQMDTSIIDKLIGNDFSIDDSRIIITDSKNVIYSSDRKTTVLTPEMNAALSNIGSNNYINAKIDNKNVLLSRSVSDTTGLTYISVIPLGTVLQQVVSLQNIFIAGILIILAVGSIIIFFLMRYNYIPVHQLSTIVKNILPGSSHSADEVEAARNALISLSERNQASVYASRELKRERLLLKLLGGNFVDTESFNAIGEEFDLLFSGSKFKVIVINFYEILHNDKFNYPDIIKYLEAIMQPDFEAYALEYSENSSIILILSIDDGNLKVLMDKLLLISAYLENDICIQCTIGVGGSYNLISEINKSYFEALTVIKHSRIKNTENQNTVFYYSELINVTDSFTYPNDAINSLYSAILNCDAEKIDLVVNILLQTLKMSKSSSLISCICYDIINTAEKAIRDLTHPAFSFKIKYSELLFKMKSDSVDFMELISKLLLEINENIESGSSKASDKNIDEILSYIKTHFMEGDFCVKKISHQFGMSISNFSHYFKSRIGQNVSDYINSIRLEKAKELLRDTDLPIQGIVNQLGYIQVSSFMRKFKSTEGKTAGEYRSLYRSRSN